ncbi:dTDP-glucose 4,6-dehydratase [Desulfovibrio litoralis]|uniref:dTDP-glucose 4,6-dehydratase n=1 Tax=Desulfovibrio litoralis DSM 11393 TaxID=1121455 RepID=A0A1M7S7F1_9BACT|nr:dTDP-glucose 4,6-dehydratase [Desulfovibrio litoralis]SHN54295.1 dTDP-glucose 4,6-dehydratase [Desulfovibrio litoralis DSM 11393]
MRIMVTGACGFIGANFLYFLFGNNGVLDNAPELVVNFDKLTYAGNLDNVKALSDKFADKKQYVFVHGDIASKEQVEQTLKDYQIDTVINFAAESHVDRSIDDPTPFIQTNVLGTQVLLSACLKFGIKRFVQVSTDEVYGSLGKDGLFTETTPLDPSSPYSASKASADLLVLAFGRTYGLDVRITRCSNNYGPYQFPEKLIPLIFRKALAGEKLPVYGDGLNVRDWIYVEDHCLGVLLTLVKGKAGGVYNFGGSAERSNIEVVKLILKELNQPESLITYVKDRPGHDRRYAMDWALAHKELGYTPRWTFEKGIKATLDWYKKNTAWLESVESGAYLEFMSKWYGER